MKRMLVPAVALLGLALAVPAFAASETAAAAQSPRMLAQAPKQDRDRDRKRPATRQRDMQRSQAPVRRAQQGPRNRPQERASSRTHVQRRFDWKQYRPGQRPPAWRKEYRFDPRGWQRNVRATNRYHWRPYHRPSGWYYRR